MTTVRPAGDAALLLDLPDTDQEGNAAAALAAVIRAAALPAVIDVVPAAATVLVAVEPGSWELADLAGRLLGLAGVAPRPTPSQPDLVLPTVYDGPDLAEVAALTGLSELGVIARHTGARYRVGWLGFSPGFSYLTGLDPALAAVPRLTTPRLSVPAGSVAIAGGFSAVYPAASPGGWRLLGRTPRVLWDADRDPPALLSPGQHVRFRIVDQLPAEPAPRPTAASSGVAGKRIIEVLQPGPLTTVQDLGRPGFAHLGVPRSGAADAASLRHANRLVRNDEAAAGLEVTLGRLAIRFESDAVVAMTGAPARLTIEPDPDGGAPAHNTGFLVRAGSLLKLGSPPGGLRSYLAVDGGIETPPVLGSRSADRLSGLGPAPLRAGDRLPLGPPRSGRDSPGTRRPPDAAPPVAIVTNPVLTGSAEPVALRAIAGPRDDWFTDAALDELAGGNYHVTAASDRTGLRLTGPPLRRSAARPGELASEGVATGSLQVTHDGQPILLLADHPTTGGYPVIAVVMSADLGRAAQLRPGDHVRFVVQRFQLG